MLRVLGWMALGIAAGFALGGIPARREKVQLAEENQRLREQLRAGSGPNLFRMLLGGGPMGELDGPTTDEGSLVAPSATDTGPAERERDAEGRPLPVRKPANGQVSVVGARGDTGSGSAGSRASGDDATRDDVPQAPLSREERRARRQRAMRSLTQGRFKQFAAAQAARAAATRASLIGNADLSEQQVARLDSAIESTNRKLQGYGEEMLTNVARGEEPEPAEALSLARDVADILHEGQTEVDRLVAESGTEVPREATQIWNLVDPEGLNEAAERLLPELPPESGDAFGPGGLTLPKPPEGFTPPAGLGDAGIPKKTSSAP